MTGFTHHDTPPLVGVRLLCSANDYSDVPIYHGVSYCDAIRRAGEGERLRVLPGSIQICRWAPVVLGLKEPKGRFERSLSPRLSFQMRGKRSDSCPVSGLLLSPVDGFPGKPEVIVVRAAPEVLWGMIENVGWERLWDGHEGRLDRSAVPLLAADKHPIPRHSLIGPVNRLLAGLARFAFWQTFTHWLFRSGLVTAGFDALISRTLANMSICRNSTVIPLLTGRANISFFCTGGITWGHNRPDHLTSGWPWPNFQPIPHKISQ